MNPLQSLMTDFKPLLVIMMIIKAPSCQNNGYVISGLWLTKKYSFVGENFVA